VRRLRGVERKSNIGIGETAPPKPLSRPRAPSAGGGSDLAHWFAGRLAFGTLALKRLGLEGSFCIGPMAVCLTVGASLIEPKEVGDLVDAIVAIGRFRLRL
jgi:hypothetical protein